MISEDTQSDDAAAAGEAGRPFTFYDLKIEGNKVVLDQPRRGCLSERHDGCR